VRGDSSLLTSLVENAVQNALKFAPDGSITVCVQGGEGAHVVLRVVDSGPGIPPEQRERVFDPFYRAKPGVAAGHGLGLALIAHIARAHGGHAHFEDVPRGAELVIRLPAW
jgi:signal transduction histidine kinase